MNCKHGKLRKVLRFLYGVTHSAGNYRRGVRSRAPCIRLGTETEISGQVSNLRGSVNRNSTKSDSRSRHDPGLSTGISIANRLLPMREHASQSKSGNKRLARLVEFLWSHRHPVLFTAKYLQPQPPTKHSKT